MRVFVTGATGALGRYLVPGLVAAVTRSPPPRRRRARSGSCARPVRSGGPGRRDREAVIAAVLAAAPEVILHEMTALGDLRSLVTRQLFLVTNELRAKGTDDLLAAAKRPAPAGSSHRGTRRRAGPAFGRG